MRFKILPYKKSIKEATASKLRSAERRLKKEREKYPLLVDWIIQQQPTAEEKVGCQLDDWHKWCQEARNRQAQAWRKSRAILGVAELMYDKAIDRGTCYQICEDLSRLKLFTETGTGISQNLR